MQSGSFSFGIPTQVRFGDGVSAQVVDVLPTGATHVAVLRGKRGIAAEALIAQLRAASLDVTEVICAGEPSVAAVNMAALNLRGQPLDAVIGCGGGAVVDSAKAIALCHAYQMIVPQDFAQVPDAYLSAPCPLPCIAVPTTAGTGAEVTANAVLDVPELQAKVSLRGRALIPSAALVDPKLLTSAPPEVLLSSGLDALVQTIEAYTSCKATPFTDAMSAPNIASGLTALKTVMATATSESYRTLAWTSLCSGLALANGGLGAAHGIASVLGARYHAPHGALCGRLLAPALEQNARAADAGSAEHVRLETCIAHISHAFPPSDPKDPLSGFLTWQEAHGLPRLGAFGVVEAAIPELASLSSTASSSQKNAVPLPVQAYADILKAAL